MHQRPMCQLNTEQLSHWSYFTEIKYQRGLIFIYIIGLLLYSGLKAIFSQYKVVPKDRNKRDHSAWKTGNGDPMHEVCILHRIPHPLYILLWNRPDGQSRHDSAVKPFRSPRNTRDHLVRTARNADPMHEVCIPHRIPRAWKQQGW